MRRLAGTNRNLGTSFGRNDTRIRYIPCISVELRPVRGAGFLVTAVLEPMRGWSTSALGKTVSARPVAFGK